MARRKPTNLLEPALDKLRQTTGLQGKILPNKAGKLDRTTAATIEIRADKRAHRLLVQIRARLDRVEALPPIKTWLKEIGRPGVVVTNGVTETVALKCRELDVPFIDTAGNAYLKLPGLFIFVAGQKLDTANDAKTAEGGLATTTALRVAFGLLCRPELVNATYREIRNATGVALGAIGPILAHLRKRGHLTGNRRKKQLQLTQPDRLLDEWVTNYPTHLRPKLRPRRFQANDPMWWKNVRPQDFNAYWGGEVAAARLTRFLKPATATLYLEPDPQANPVTPLVAKHRLQANRKGDIELLEKFWQFPNDRGTPDTVPPILVYADLVATLEPRNLEVAQLVKERYIDLATHTI